MYKIKKKREYKRLWKNDKVEEKKEKQIIIDNLT